MLIGDYLQYVKTSDDLITDFTRTPTVVDDMDLEKDFLQLIFVHRHLCFFWISICCLK